MDESKIGIHYGALIINIIVYADDTLIVTNSAKSMKKLIAELETFAMNSEFEINVKKTFILTKNPNPEQ